MNTTNDQKDFQDERIGKRRNCLGCLGRGAIGLMILLVVVLMAGVIYQSTSSANDLKY